MRNMMKKIISLLLIAMMCLSFVVCGNRIYLIDSSLTKTAPQAWKTPVGRHILSKIKGFFGCVSHCVDVGADVEIESG